MLNGLLVSLLLRNHISVLHDVLSPFEAQIVFAFMFSIGFNAAILCVLFLVGLPIGDSLWALLLFASVFVALLFRIGWHGFKSLVLSTEFGLVRAVLYCFVFVVIFYNGGLIEQISDAWWHMSQANMISLVNSFNLPQGHLTGEPGRYYPPLWHANLALLKTLSGESLPVIWNSFTAWGAVLKVMAFYLLSLGLTRDRTISTFAAVLFLILPGMGVSYLRVSAWPSHIAYIATFFAMYLTFQLLRAQSSGVQVDQESFSSALRPLLPQWPVLIILLLVAGLIFFTHQLELVWFALAFFFALGLAVLLESLFSMPNEAFKGLGSRLFRRLLLGIAALAVISLTLYRALVEGALSANADQIFALSSGLLILFLVTYGLVASRYSSMSFGVVGFTLLIISLLVIFIGIDYTHLYSLFNPEYAHQSGSAFHDAHRIRGLFGFEVQLPTWHLQLRRALLFSGLLSVPLSWLLVFRFRDAATVFLAANATFALLFCLSPYFYEFLAQLMDYHSSWRIVFLIFHPIIWAITLCWAGRSLFSSELNTKT